MRTCASRMACMPNRPPRTAGYLDMYACEGLPINFDRVPRQILCRLAHGPRIAFSLLTHIQNDEGTSPSHLLCIDTTKANHLMLPASEGFQNAMHDAHACRVLEHTLLPNETIYTQVFLPLDLDKDLYVVGFASEVVNPVHLHHFVTYLCTDDVEQLYSPPLPAGSPQEPKSAENNGAMLSKTVFGTTTAVPSPDRTITFMISWPRSLCPATALKACRCIALKSAAVQGISWTHACRISTTGRLVRPRHL
jgi:hypothetical protein